MALVAYLNKIKVDFLIFYFMNHVAIMKKSWKLLPKIISGEKTVESRWYMTRHMPWNSIFKGDRVFFKDSGEPVTVQTCVRNVLQFSNLTPLKVHEILFRYGEEDGISAHEISQYEKMFRDKKYCILVFLEKVRTVTPFFISKKGFGAMSAWITVPDVDVIRVHG